MSFILKIVSELSLNSTLKFKPFNKNNSLAQKGISQSTSSSHTKKGRNSCLFSVNHKPGSRRCTFYARSHSIGTTTLTTWISLTEVYSRRIMKSESLSNKARFRQLGSTAWSCLPPQVGKLFHCHKSNK